ncbi:3-hydroxybutyrate dehydrogenase [Brevundimonas sp. EAKA]|jgi:3-hydroxybutyrate dehydrogenase|uniref:D-xylose 1-dehydrogenase n=1 Tax=Brevundimonas mediterranea TaxID=74329 RepID=A0A6G7EKP7_9CAUL|nr:3-hydroxybutyrate dehydrogenase subfamily [Brevundimonas sp. BAL3]KDP93174.1 3-hydroxybutyrate dehydrogenase [Brevundimonas sp. EAKA]MBA4332469.1 3-hydroxybutyrate dehydrogenase [Brevundimonas sp.]MBU4196081.1 3-hydroxybutyrate dehydrogenase [Alphaproteobacteria bacterium]QIH74195.1 3-hydroxybutyrate dehydrogenase [Brevundimonas mediterranea]
MFNWSKSSKGPSAAPAAAHGDAPVFRDIGDLKGQVAVISGSTSGIGLALARAVAARGGDVVLNGLGDPAEIERTRAGLEAGSSGRVRYHAANMMRGDEIADMVAFAKHEFGRLDILVNNAGIQHVESVEKFPTDKWEQIIAINLSSAFYATRAAIPIMKAQGRGRIVNMASAHGLVASPFKSAYVAAKHGIVGFTKTVALELAQDNITCNAICPGFVETPIVEKQIADQARTRGISKEQVLHDVILAAQPTKKFVTTDQLAGLFLYLVSDLGASANGASFSIDGGWTAQ